jgi:Transmembrane domain of unknown function (DUF3566)
MTERSAEQAPVETRPDHQDTARIPLAERLQRRIAAADQRRAGTQAPREAQRVLPPMPPELQQQSEPAPAPRPEPANRAVQPVPEHRAPDQTAQTPVVAARPSATQRRTPARSAAPRRARLRLSRIDPWSVMKVSFLLSLAFGIVTVVSVFLVWSVLGAAGVWDSINNTVSDTVSSGNNVSSFDITDYLGMSRVLGFTMLVSVIDVVLITAIATLGAFLYNMAASLLGGIEVTLAEDA